MHQQIKKRQFYEPERQSNKSKSWFCQSKFWPKIFSPLRWQIVLYASFVFLQSLQFFGGVMVPFLTTWGGISFTQMMFLQAWFSFCLFVAEIPTGAVADFLGRKYSLMLGGLFGSVAMLVYSARPAFVNFLFAEFAFALAMSLTSGADQALLYDSLKEHGKHSQGKKIIGLAHSVHLIAMLVASPLGGLMAKHWGLNMPIALTAIPLALSMIIASLLREPAKFDQQIESLRYWQIVKDGSLFFFKNKQLLAMVLEGVIVASTAHFVVWLNQPLLAEAGLDVAYFGLVNSAMIAVEVAVSSNFALIDAFLAKVSANYLKNFYNLAKKHQLKSSIFWRLLPFEINYANLSFCIVTLAFILALFSRQVLPLLLFAMIAGGFGYTRLIYLSASLHELIPSSKRATVISSLSMFRRFFQMFLDPVIGVLMDIRLRLAVLFIVIFLIISKLAIAYFLQPAKSALAQISLKADLP